MKIEEVDVATIIVSDHIVVEHVEPNVFTSYSVSGQEYDIDSVYEEVRCYWDAVGELDTFGSIIHSWVSKDWGILSS
jgi:hypothetical protein